MGCHACNAVKLCSLCPRAPGAGCGVAWAAGSSLRWRPCMAHLRRGTPTHVSKRGGRVAGTLEKGGEVPSLAWAPARPTEPGTWKLASATVCGCCQALWLSLKFPPSPSG